ncbi:Phosphatidylinositol-glycan biosynthesis class like protein [Argiope bruennichi]|uniref:Phosphatidylinositol-glycan biosynthesis class like protein n=1 Tax=Argiope bruennichi TaxID=94029 RepID=A0A8T0EP27_ARGBR|nr:Phosphatidylinositol-glycan biosynthesis class like protein [Argiope bruennichi]
MQTVCKTPFECFRSWQAFAWLEAGQSITTVAKEEVVSKTVISRLKKFTEMLCENMLVAIEKTPQDDRYISLSEKEQKSHSKSNNRRSCIRYRYTCIYLPEPFLGGVCYKDNDVPKCNCVGTCTGDNCDEDACKGHACNNGGKCYKDNNVPKCNCVGTWKGDHCDEDVCQGHVCNNGGKCYKDNDLPKCNWLEHGKEIIVTKMYAKIIWDVGKETPFKNGGKKWVPKNLEKNSVVSFYGTWAGENLLNKGKQIIMTYSLMVTGHFLCFKEKNLLLQNLGNKPDEHRFDLNVFHTNFLLVRDKTAHKSGVNRFLLKLEDAFRGFHSGTSDDVSTFLPSSPVPVIAVLVQGNLNSVHYILAHLKRKLPILVIRGSGGLADILAYAYYEVQRSFEKIKDVEYVENILKKSLSDKITAVFPTLKDNKMAHRLLCDRLLDCVRCAEPPKLRYITVFSTLDLDRDIEDLPSHLLETIFKAQKSDVSNFHAHLKRDLLLTIDWNCPHLAVTKVFYKDPSFKVENDVFEQTLLSKDREEFISMFLDHGFEIHKYMNSSRVITLFEKALTEDFFREVCWERILGYRRIMMLDDYFIDSDLNWIIENLMGMPIYISSKELNECSAGIFNLDCPKELASDVARSRQEPLLLYMAQFADMAVGVFDLCYNDMPSKAYDALSVKNKDWGGHSLIDMAALAQGGGGKGCSAHPVVQKWLTQVMGKIKRRGSSWVHDHIPTYFKVILCAFFVYPMYLWVRFKETSDEEFVGSNEYEASDPYYTTSNAPRNKNTFSSLNALSINKKSVLTTFSTPFATSEEGKADKFPNKKLEKKEFSVAKGVTALTVSIALFHVFSILFGAPVFEVYLDTLYFSVLMTLLTAYPLMWYFFFCDSQNAVLKILSDSKFDNLTESYLHSIILWTVFGAWIGAFPIPLDWDRPWQTWPITCCIGASLGNSIIHFIIGFKLIYGLFGDRRKTTLNRSV